MIPIKIDTREISEEFNLTKSNTEEMMSFIVKELTGLFAREWQVQASKVLTSSRKEFLNSIIIGEEGRFRGYVMLVGQVPNMIEDGAEPFDMKVGFLQSSKVTQGKSGPYLTIPRRFATPGALGESGVFSEVLPEEIYAIVRGKESAKSTLGGGVNKGAGLKLEEIPAQFQIPKTRERIVAKSRIWEAYTNKSSKYEGLQRVQKTYESATQGNYVSFRRVSSESDPDSWIHSGMSPGHFAEKALESLNIPSIVDQKVDHFLTKLGF